jgi:glucokinase
MTASATSTVSLVADIGGTNTRVALADGDRVLPDTVRRLPNAEFPGLEQVLRHYLSDLGGPGCAGACVAVAGPVRGNSASLTNLDWAIDTDVLARATGAQVAAILNDLQAQGHALGRIAPDRIRTLVPGGAGATEDPSATRLVVGVGTGFNAAPVFGSGPARRVEPSEAGHVNLVVRHAEDADLARWLDTAHGFPSVEDALSGRGLERLYAWRAQAAGTPRDLPAASIMAALQDDDPLAGAAMAAFARQLGAVCGNLALVHLPFGGIYLVGGVARAAAPWLDRFGFAVAFRDKGRFAGFMDSFAIHLVEDDFAALTGCAAHLSGHAARIGTGPGGA